MYSQAAELLCRNEKICSHRTRKWYSWLLVWKEELFSPTLHGRLCLCPWMSAHASLLNKHIPHLTWQADMSAMKAGCLLIGKQGYPDLGANSVKLRRSCWVWVYNQLWDVPSIPEKSGVRMVWFSWLVSEDLIVWETKDLVSEWPKRGDLPLEHLPRSLSLCLPILHLIHRGDLTEPVKWLWRQLGLRARAGFEPCG